MSDSTYTSNFCAFSYAGLEFDLRTVNANLFPLRPNHPRLTARFSAATPPPILANGTYGDLDWLYNTYTYLPKSPWVHYIPTQLMFKDGVPGYSTVPFLEVPDHVTGGLWIRQGETGKGYFLDTFLEELQRFYKDGCTQAMSYLNSAKVHCRLPIRDEELQWETVNTVGPYMDMMTNLMRIQRRIAELYGWIFMQEKLQPDRPSFYPRAPLAINRASGVPSLDAFNGVIIDWDAPSDGFDRQAISHGLPVWWVCYKTDPAQDRPPWKGLPRASLAVSRLHRGAGYVPLQKSDVSLTYCLQPGSSGSLLDDVVSRSEIERKRYNQWLPLRAGGSEYAALVLKPAVPYPSSVAGPSSFIAGLSTAVNPPPQPPATLLDVRGALKRCHGQPSDPLPKPRPPPVLEAERERIARGEATCQAHLAAGTAKLRNAAQRQKARRPTKMELEAQKALAGSTPAPTSE
ncbi:hypothetical protein BOTBODRAFT_171280 [Botryobasidium botryosum FD-172 SS1]|uniref:Uncharacterized protein n=1 Tax=Botryobasidium botryosum (strain FD-172 SS1) TaxID=930990 RepID=A0A067MRR9_BOTB1|nr:hypothetical protein BOTBODRAFT_171280 [Botryobasidium botryosum FD-172 SS1]